MGEQEGHLLELDQLAHGAVAHGEVGEELQGLGDDRLVGAPVLQVRYAIRTKIRRKKKSKLREIHCHDITLIL